MESKTADYSFTKQDTLCIKGIAIMMLLFHHLFYQEEYFTQCNLKTLLPQSFVIDLGIVARTCVWIFAFCSAYGISILLKKAGQNQDKIKYGRFVFERWVPLMASFWVLYILCFIAMFIIGKNPLDTYDHNAGKLILDVFALSDFFNTPKMFGVFWYMFFAQTIVFVVPLIKAVVEKFGWYTLLATYVLMPFINVGIKSPQGGAYINYLPVVVLGVLFAEYETFEKLKAKRSVIKGVINAVVILLLLWLKLFVSGLGDAIEPRNLMGLVTSLAAVAICIFAFLYIGGWLKKVLVFLGKHAGNIFIIHAFIKTYYREEVCFTGNVIVSWFLLLIISLVISIIIEFLKKVTHYNQGIMYVKEKILSLQIFAERSC